VRGVSVATPDAPLLHFGGFTNHKHQPELVMEQPYFVSWPMNNHWWTNFAQKQSGWTRFRYRLLPYQGGFDAARATRLGAEIAAEPLILPVTDRESGYLMRSVDVPQHLPESTGLFAAAPESVLIAGLKPADDGRGIIVRLQEIGGQATTAQLTFNGATIDSVEGCNLLEEPDGTGGVYAEPDIVRVEIAPYRLRTVRVIFKVVH
jgi:alpha-mannosidase